MSAVKEEVSVQCPVMPGTMLMNRHGEVFFRGTCNIYNEAFDLSENMCLG